MIHLFAFGEVGLSQPKVPVPEQRAGCSVSHSIASWVRGHAPPSGTYTSPSWSETIQISLKKGKGCSEMIGPSSGAPMRAHFETRRTTASLGRSSSTKSPLPLAKLQ